VAWPGGSGTHGLDAVVYGISGNYDDGLRYRLANVVASRDIIIWRSRTSTRSTIPTTAPARRHGRIY
jgi:hypothetical protein